MRVCIVGAGYVGLALADLISQSDHNVILYDTDTTKDSCHHLVVHHTMPRGCDIYLITVPTPVDENNKPDYTYVKQAAEAIAYAMDPIDITHVILESTVGVGTTRNIVAPILAKTGMPHGVGFSPERVSPGDTSISDAVKIISALDDDTLGFLEMFYGQFFELHKVATPEIAEMAKLVENAQRDVNIAFMNECNELAELQDVPFQQVLAACRTKWNFADYKPGLVGGHCIAVDPYFLMEGNPIEDMELTMLEGAREVNSCEPNLVAMRIYHAAPKDCGTIIVLGFGYKPNSKDSRNSGVFPVVEALDNLVRTCSPKHEIVHLYNRDAYDLFIKEHGIKKRFVAVVIEDDQFADIEAFRLYKD